VYYYLKFGDGDQVHKGVKKMRTVDGEVLQEKTVSLGMNLQAQWLDNRWFRAVVHKISDTSMSVDQKNVVRSVVELQKDQKVWPFFFLFFFFFFFFF